MPRRYLLDFEKPLVELEKQIEQIRNTSLEWERFTTGNTHTAWVIVGN